MPSLLSETDLPLPNDPAALRAEIERLRQVVRATAAEKDRALRLLRTSNTALHGQVQGQTRQLAALNHLTNTITGSLDLRRVANTALEGLKSLLNVEAACLALREPDGQLAYFLALPESLMPPLAGWGATLDQGLAGRVAATGRIALSNDAAELAETLTPAERALGLTFRSVLYAPLIAPAATIGVVQLINKWNGPFVDGDQAFVETVCGALAVAVENARIHAALQTQLSTLERTHAELVATQAQLVQSAKLGSIGQLAAGLAHEINNPVGIILGFAQLAGQRAPDDKLKGYAANIEREALRVQRITSDLLNFARQATAETARLDLRTVVDHALQLMEYQLGREGITLVHARSPEPAWVLADPNQLLQVMLNLLQNARQAMPSGGRLTVAWASAAGQQRVSVTDTGPGIPPEQLERIFDPFYTTKPVGHGTGLGLSVSYGLIQRHGGQIRVTSLPGAGATFEVSLPAAPEA